MTTISSGVQPPSVEGEARPAVDEWRAPGIASSRVAEGEAGLVRNEWSARPLLLLVGLSVVLVTIMNLTAAVYLYRGSGQVMAAEQRLKDLAEFDARIRAKIDLMNNGVQGQFDKLNAELRSSFSEVYGRIAGFEEKLADVADDLAESSREGIWGPDLPSVSVVNPTRPDGPAAPDSPESEAQPGGTPTSGTAGMPPASSDYRRIEAADGRVFYRKVR